MKTLTLLVLCLFPVLALAAEVAEVFTDKGSVFVRAGTRQGLSVGTELALSVNASGAPESGRATVMEVWESLARLNVAAAGSKRFRFARMASHPTATAPPNSPAAAPAAMPAPVPEQPTAPAAKVLDAGNEGKGPRLQGRAEKGALRLTLYNQSDVPWTNCELRFPDSGHYTLDLLAAHSDDGILLVKFRRDPDPPFDHVNVRCDEGESKFILAEPSRHAGALKGYVEVEGGGRVIIHNTSEVTWNRCDLKLPDGRHYVLGKLGAQSDDGIRPSLFTKVGPPSDHLDVRCAEGQGRFPL